MGCCQPAGQAEMTGEATLPTNQVGKRTHPGDKRGKRGGALKTQHAVGVQSSHHEVQDGSKELQEQQRHLAG